MLKLDLEKVEEPEIKLPISFGSLKKQESSRKNIYFCFIDYVIAFDLVDQNKLWKILKQIEIPDHLPASWEICIHVMKQQFEPDMGQLASSKWEGVHQGCILSPCLFKFYAVYIMKILGWMKHNLASR